MTERDWNYKLKSEEDWNSNKMKLKLLAKRMKWTIEELNARSCVNDEVVKCITKLITNPALSELNAVSFSSDLKNVQNKE